MSSYGLEFPRGAEYKDRMFSTLEKLNLYERENLIMNGVLTAQMLTDAFDRLSQQIGIPEAYISPKVLKALRKHSK